MMQQCTVIVLILMTFRDDYIKDDGNHVKREAELTTILIIHEDLIMLQVKTRLYSQEKLFSTCG